jgi:hypothetical protein
MCWRNGIGIHADARYAACRPRLTAAQGLRVEQRAIVARTFQKSQSKAGAARWTLPSLLSFFRSVSSGFVDSGFVSAVDSRLPDVYPVQYRWCAAFGISPVNS